MISLGAELILSPPYNHKSNGLGKRHAQKSISEDSNFEMSNEDALDSSFGQSCGLYDLSGT